jgi:hypothetical protein
VAGQWKNYVQFQTVTIYFSFLENIQTGLGAQPAPYSGDVGDVVLVVKLAMA